MLTFISEDQENKTKARELARSLYNEAGRLYEWGRDRDADECIRQIHQLLVLSGMYRKDERDQLFRRWDDEQIISEDLLIQWEAVMPTPSIEDLRRMHRAFLYFSCILSASQVVSIPRNDYDAVADAILDWREDEWFACAHELGIELPSPETVDMTFWLLKAYAVFSWSS